MATNKSFIAIDVGEKRIGVARGDSSIKLAHPLVTIEVDGEEIEKLNQLIDFENVDGLVVGYPRNQSGEPTKQTKMIEDFVARLNIQVPIIFQDESLTSVMAEQRLKDQGKPYSKSDIDNMAAAIILQDYLENASE